MPKINKVHNLYKELLQKHGHPRQLWPQWCAKNKSENLRQLVATGAILVQRTSWRNAEKALVNLKTQNMLSIKKIERIDIRKLTKLVRVAGFYTTKPRRLQELCRYVLTNYDGFSKMVHRPIEKIREELLSVYGIGPETADTLILYALDKPSFIIDEYTKRFVESNKLANTKKLRQIKNAV